MWHKFRGVQDLWQFVTGEGIKNTKWCDIFYGRPSALLLHELNPLWATHHTYRLDITSDHDNDDDYDDDDDDDDNNWYSDVV